MQKQDKKEFKTRINKYIKSPQVKVVSEDGSFLGVMNTYEALKMAQEKGLDLVEINSKVYPPLVKITDYGKFKYEQKKQQKEEKKKQKIQEIKELAFHINTGDNDLKRQVEQARGFLKDGNKVRFILKIRGREMSFQNLAENKLKWILSELINDISFNTPISTENRNMSTILSPK